MTGPTRKKKGKKAGSDQVAETGRERLKAADQLDRLVWEIGEVAAGRIKRNDLLQNEVDAVERARGAPLTPEEVDAIDRGIARRQYTMQLAARLRRTGSLPRDELERLQSRIGELLPQAESHVEQQWVLAPQQVETVLLALELAASVPWMREQWARLRDKHAYAFSALNAKGDIAAEEPSLNTRLRVMLNRLLGRKDRTPLRTNLLPADDILLDWKNLTERRSTKLPPRPIRKEDIGKAVSKETALGILRERYGFASTYACLKYLERLGVRGLPAIRGR